MAQAKTPLTKTQIMANIAETTGLTKKQVAEVFDALTEQIRKSLSSRGVGVFTIPGLLKIERKDVPARPAKKNVRNPFTGELYDKAATPASKKIKVRPLKSLKDMV